MSGSGTINNPFDLSARRPAARDSQHHGPKSSADEINQRELLRTLEQLNRSQTPNPRHAEKFERYLDEGLSHGHLQDSDTAAAFNVFVTRKIKANDTTLLELLVSDDSSLLRDHCRHIGQADELAPLLLDFAQRALKAQREGRDLQNNPLPLHNQDEWADSGRLVEMLTARTGGLSTDAPRLRELQRTRDPALKLVYQIAEHCGLGASIRATQTALRTGQENELTQGLQDIPSLLKKEYNKLNEILESDGSIVIGYTDHGTAKIICPIQLEQRHLDILGPDAKYFKPLESLNFRDFFQTAHALAIDGNTEELTSHVARGMSLITAYYNLELNQDGIAQGYRDRLSQEYKELARMMQGKGLLPATMAKIVRERVADACISKDFNDRATAGIANPVATKLIGDFIQELSTNTEFTNQVQLRGLINPSRQIIVPHEDDSETAHSLKWIDTNQIRTPSQVEENRSLTNNGSISVARAVEAYQRAVDISANRISQAIIERCDPVDMRAAVVMQTKHDIAQAVREVAPFADINSIKTFINTQLSTISRKKVNQGNKELQEALLRFSTKITGINHSLLSKDKKYESTRTAIENIVTDIINADPLQNSIGAFVDHLLELRSNNERHLRASFNNDEGKEAMQTLLENCVRDGSLEARFTDQINLGHISTIFTGSEGEALARKLEELSTPGARSPEIIASNGAECYGAFPNLLFAIDTAGQPDTAKRLSTLSYLIAKTATSPDQLSRLLRHTANQLAAGTATDRSRLETKLGQAVGYIRTVENNVNQLIRDHHRSIVLNDNLADMRRKSRNIEEHGGSLLIRRFGDEQRYKEIRTALQTIQSYAERIGTGSDDCLTELKRSLDSDGHSLAYSLLHRLIYGIETKIRPEAEADLHPASLIEGVLEDIESLLLSRNLANFGRDTKPGETT